MAALYSAFLRSLRAASRHLPSAARPAAQEPISQICVPASAQMACARRFSALPTRGVLPPGSISMLPWSSVAEQVRSIQKTAGGDFLPSAANEQADDSMGRNAGMSFDDVEVGKVYEGRVVNLANFGCFVNFGCEMDCLVHISQMSESFVRDVSDVVSVGTDVRVKILNKDDDRRRISGTFRNSDMESRGQDSY